MIKDYDIFANNYDDDNYDDDFDDLFENELLCDNCNRFFEMRDLDKEVCPYCGTEYIFMEKNSVRLALLYLKAKWN